MCYASGVDEAEAVRVFEKPASLRRIGEARVRIAVVEREYVYGKPRRMLAAPARHHLDRIVVRIAAVVRIVPQARVVERILIGDGAVRRRHEVARHAVPGRRLEHRARGLAAHQVEHSREFGQSNAEWRGREDQHATSVLLLPAQRMTEGGVIAFGPMGLIDNQQVACPVSYTHLTLPTNYPV